QPRHRFGPAVHIGFAYDVHLLRPSRRDLSGPRFQWYTMRTAVRALPPAVLSELARRSRVFDDDERLARPRHRIEPHDLRRHRRRRLADAPASIIEHCLELAPALPSHHRVAHSQG